MQISDYELTLMKTIWSHGGEAMYNEIQEDLNQNEEQWTKNTIITLLSRLVDKKMLTTNKIGRRNKYKAIVTEAEYQKSQTIHFLDKVYGGNPKELVATLLETKLFSEDDYKELNDYWEEEIKKNG